MTLSLWGWTAIYRYRSNGFGFGVLSLWCLGSCVLRRSAMGCPPLFCGGFVFCFGWFRMVGGEECTDVLLVLGLQKYEFFAGSLEWVLDDMEPSLLGFDWLLQSLI